MQFIDEKFKDDNPVNTTKKIKKILSDLGIETVEKWNDSKIENCCSLRLTAAGGTPGTNGKGVTKDFASASAYGEFMERLQSGLFFYKYQSFENDPSVWLQSFAPDKKYVSKEELLEDSEWMDPICKKFGITKQTLADDCQIFNGEGDILVLPFYSLFEDKYTYLPAKFVEIIYGSNGCCVGNTREEAWVHALSEIFERNSTISVVVSGNPVPVIPREKLKNFKIVNKIIDTIEAQNKYTVEVLDFSCGKKYPVIATRIINRETKGYIVNVGADPVFEIAVERTLTEIFQGRNLDNFASFNTGRVLSNIKEVRAVDNASNQAETGNGLFAVDFFADNTLQDDTDSFTDNSDKTNKELLKFVLDKYKELDLNVYVRNNSFLGFPCYMLVVPGYSDILGEQLRAPVLEYYFADKAAKTFRNLKKATNDEISQMLTYINMIKGHFSKRVNYTFLSGLPINKKSYMSSLPYLAYAALKIGNKPLFYSYITNAINGNIDQENKEYLSAVKQWVTFCDGGVEKDKALSTIRKFYPEAIYQKLVENIEKDELLDECIVECTMDCKQCRSRDYCQYENIRKIIAIAGKEYAKFIHGQDRNNFIY